MRFKLVEELLMETSLKELEKFATMVKKAVSKDKYKKNAIVDQSPKKGEKVKMEKMQKTQ